MPHFEMLHWYDGLGFLIWENEAAREMHILQFIEKFHVWHTGMHTISDKDHWSLNHQNKTSQMTTTMLFTLYYLYQVQHKSESKELSKGRGLTPTPCVPTIQRQACLLPCWWFSILHHIFQCCKKQKMNLSGRRPNNSMQNADLWNNHFSCIFCSHSWT